VQEAPRSFSDSRDNRLGSNRPASFPLDPETDKRVRPPPLREKENRKEQKKKQDRPKKKEKPKKKKEQRVPVIAGCFRICDTLIFEVYMLLGGSLCECIV